MKMQWRYGLIVALILTFFSMYPQLRLWYIRGNEWQGHYAYNDPDEVAYAAYLRSLIDGKPRKNDAYTGREDNETQGESFLSIQFAAPYTIAIPAKILGISAPTAFWLSGAIGAFLVGLFLFWLISQITKDPLFAFTGALSVICFAPIISSWGAILGILEIGDPHPFHPIFRRYVPILAFVGFLLTLNFMWLMLKENDQKKRILFCFLSALCFSYCVFSYFYIWTTAFALIICLSLLWFIFRPQEENQNWQKALYALLALIFGCLIPLIPYALMIMNRTYTSDQVQGLASTREPYLKMILADGVYFKAITELTCYLLLLIVVLLAVLKIIKLRSHQILFTLSLILTPIITLNQQIITGKILQPFHYQLYIGNYVTTLAIVLVLWVIWQKFQNVLSKRVLVEICAIAIFWGFVECYYTANELDSVNLLRDEAVPVAKRLEELSKTETRKGVVFVPDIDQGDDLPTLTSYPPLWAIHMHAFPSLTWQENKERLYQHLYFSGLNNAEQMFNLMERRKVFSIIAIFGWSRWSKLNPKAEPITYEEVTNEARTFEEYVKNFDPRKSPETVVSYVIVPADWNFDFSNFDKFYERSNPEIHGRYLLYRSKLRNN